MKKAMVAVVVCLFMVMGLQAQTWKEWFRQKQTQIQYLGEQIAALKVYGDYVSKGYRIARRGLTDIGDTKDGDLDMHTGYLTSLRKVSPRVKTYWKAAAIGPLQTRITAACQKQLEVLRHANQFTPGEITYAKKVLAAVLDDCNSLLQQLFELTTDGGAEMKDDERLTAISRIYKAVQDAYTFLQQFGSEAAVLAAQRKERASDVKSSRSLVNIHSFK